MNSAKEQLDEWVKQKEYFHFFYGYPPTKEKPKANLWLCAFHVIFTAFNFGMAPVFLFYTPEIPLWGRIFCALVWLYGGVSSMLDFTCEVIGRRDLRK